MTDSTVLVSTWFDGLFVIEGDRDRAIGRAAPPRSLPPSALRGADAGCRRGDPTVRPARCPARVVDGSHARSAPVPRRGQRLLSRQEERHDRRRARPAVREANSLSGALRRRQLRRPRQAGQTHATPLASHDDTTLEHVTQSLKDGVAIAEFPTTVEAASALHEAGVKVLMGAPNLVRGKSHAGKHSHRRSGTGRACSTSCRGTTCRRGC